VDAIAERALALNMYLTSMLESAGFEVFSPGSSHRSAETLVALPDPPGTARFLLQRAIHVSEKPEGVRIATHYYNDEHDVDTCVAALCEYRDRSPR